MKLLLDSHIFLWYISADPRLPTAHHNAIRDPANEVYLSVASIWESVIKYALRKLPLPEAPAEYLPRQRDAHRIASLPIDEGVSCTSPAWRRSSRSVRPHPDCTIAWNTA